MRDLRDPTELGNKLLEARQLVKASHPAATKPPCHWSADHAALHVRDYASNLGPLEKYGRPQDIPSTMPNAVE